MCLCAALSLVPVQVREPVALLCRLHAKLETTKFAEFWADLADASKEASEGKALLDGMPGFVAAVRAFIVATLSLTFQVSFARPTFQVSVCVRARVRMGKTLNWW